MSLRGTAWAPIGPSPISEGTLEANGLCAAIAVLPSNPNVIYMGTAGGGIWKTRDGGTSWTPIFDRQLALGIGEPGALAIDPGNPSVIYVGTSARNALVQQQAGLFKSTDGGASWIQLGSGYPAGNTGNAIQFVNQWINVVIVDPANSNILYLGSTSGFFRSTDGGRNWTAGVGANGDVRSLGLDASTPAGARILHAGISGRGVFRSNDGGQNWTQTLSATTPAVAAVLGAGSIGETIVALAPPTSPANPAGVQVLYASCEGRGGAPDPVGLFMSTDQGGTWTQRTATGMPTGTQGGYSFQMAVDPGSPGDGANDRIFFGAVGHARSTDSGSTFTALLGVHADAHSWAFVPQPSPTPSIVYCGNDGGLYRSTDGGVTWTSLGGGGVQTGLFYNIDFRPDATGSVNVGALQDNAVETTTGATGAGWRGTLGGDGWDVAYDNVTANRVYASSGFWSTTPPAPPIPCTLVHRSDDNGNNWPNTITPWTTATDAGCYLAPVATDPSTADIVYVSGSQNLWQSRDAGGTWRILSPFAGTGQIAIAAANGNNVAIGVSNRVFVSTNALAATVGAPAGVTFTDITRNLPPRTVTRVAFDPSDPSVVYAVLGGFNGAPGNVGHVFRTTVGGTAWTDISPVLDLPVNAIALDGSETPTTLYIGTDFGVLRSVDGGATWYVLDDLHFPRVPVFDLVFRDGLLRAGTYGRGVFDFVRPQGPSIAMNLQNDLKFGDVCGGPQFLTLEIFNVGQSDLVVSSVQRLMGSTSFFVLATPGTPLVIAPGEHVDFTVRYDPTTSGPTETATIRIVSNDPNAPAVDLSATGRRTAARITTAVADSGAFGDVCLGSFVDRALTINNSGPCPLRVLGITSSSGEFVPPSVVSYPLLVASGDSVALPIRFQPSSVGNKTATLTVTSTDPNGPRLIAVSGVAPAPRLALMLADSGNFGKVCVDSFVDRPLTLANSGRCTLTVTGITSSSGEFLVPQVIAFPLTLAPGTSVEAPIRFQPTSFGPKSGTVTVTSDDPSSPASIAVSGHAPSGTIAITGSTCFGGVTACCTADRTIAICNVGDCKLHIASVAFKRPSPHWKLVNNPFPATLHPGSCLSVLIRYKATEKCPKSSELLVTSDDPVSPVKIMDLLAHTIWSECGCASCCDDCKRGHCEKSHGGGCTKAGCYDCCDEEEDARDDT